MRTLTVVHGKRNAVHIIRYHYVSYIKGSSAFRTARKTADK